ncbi:uncharacterized protein RJT21DRAFT_1270 [Scheffersomyces amazonensis]|uniref:uncharacterized protein n=1 Tax=Scheffersomyces amazonensis TaxID=1078765 RepID=UPI00315DCA10
MQFSLATIAVLALAATAEAANNTTSSSKAGAAEIVNSISGTVLGAVIAGATIIYIIHFLDN